MPQTDIKALRDLLAAAQDGSWVPSEEKTELAAALYNAAPALLDELEEAREYREMVEAGEETVQALLDSGERARGEACELRQKLMRLDRENAALREFRDGIAELFPREVPR